MKYYIIDLFRKEIVSQGYTISEARNKLFFPPQNIYITSAMSEKEALAKI